MSAYAYSQPEIDSMYVDYVAHCETLQINPMPKHEFNEHPEFYLMNPCHNFKGITP